MMPLRPLYGHHALRARLAAAMHGGRLPASLLLTGPAGVGKQRLALWLGQRLLCDGAAAQGTTEPCDTCLHCRYARQLQHPDLHWYFPRRKPKSGDVSPEEAKADLTDAIADRMTAQGLWAGSDGMALLYLDLTRALLQAASLRPSIAARTVFVVGDAERMGAQAGSEQAANAFLKLLEEPPPGTTLILTSSEPGMLLPTIRSRVVTLRVPPLPPADVAAFLDDEAVATRLGAAALDRSELLARAAGAPGRLLDDGADRDAFDAARRLLEAALAPRTPAGEALRAIAAGAQGIKEARGAFSDTLDALTVLLHEHMRDSVEQGFDRHARRSAAAIAVLEEAKTRTRQNVTPLLLSWTLIDDLSALLASPA